MKYFIPRTIDPDDYPISTSVRTDGKNLFVDEETLLHLLRIDSRYLQRVRKGYRRVKSHSIAVFPQPINIEGKEWWSLSAIRNFEMTEGMQWLEQQGAVANSGAIEPCSIADVEVDMDYLAYALNRTYDEIKNICDFCSVKHMAKNPFPLPLKDETGKSRNAWSLAELAGWTQNDMESNVASAKHFLKEKAGVDMEYLPHAIDELERVVRGNRAILETILGLDFDIQAAQERALRQAMMKNEVPIDPVLKRAWSVLIPSPTGAEQVFNAYREILREMFRAGLSKSDGSLEEFIQWMNAVVEGHYEMYEDEDEYEYEDDVTTTGQCPLCDRVLGQYADDKVGIEFIEEFFGLSRELIRIMSSKYCEENDFFPVPIVKDEEGTDKDLWSIVDLLVWHENSLEHSIERTQAFLVGMMNGFEVVRKGRISLLEKHFGVDLESFKEESDEDSAPSQGQ